MTTHIYVYYRVAPGARENATAAVASVLTQVNATTGVPGRLLRREDDPGTWMEVYESVGDTAEFCAALARISAEAGLDAIVGGGDARHIERFVESTPCVW